jgi:hypothetical protein
MATNSNDNNNNDNSKVIELKQNEKLKQSGLVTKSIYYIDTHAVKISLNHEACTDIIFTIDHKKWQNNLDIIDEMAEENGIHDKESKFLLKGHLNDNYNEIIIESSKKDKEERRQEEEEESLSLPQELVELVLKNSIELFKDEFKVPHIQVVLNNHYKTLPIDSTKFKRYLSKLYSNTKEDKIANAEAINSAISRLEAEAFYEGRTIPLHLRVAWDNPDTTQTIYYDLSPDEKNRCIKITKDGWQIVENQTDVLFRRYDHLEPQVEPIKTTFDGIDSIDSKMFDEFISLFNLKNKDSEENTEDIKLLLKCYIISLFIPDIPKPILLLHGEQGGAKSTFQEFIKMLVDPSITKTLTFPKDTNEFIQQLSHNYIAYYDNVSAIQDWISDLLCRAVTGSSFSKRALYTNDDDIYYNFKRIIGINGIDLAATKADLLDRSIIIQTERIDKKDRVKIKKIWEKFNQLKPYILGYIFDLLAKVLKYKDEHGEIDFPNGLNRMADWEEYCEIISRRMGNPDGEFQRVYQENIGVQIDEAIESSPLSQTIIELMNEEIPTRIIDKETGKEIKNIRDKWSGTPTELHTELQNIAVGKLNLIISKIKSFPKSASSLTRKINGVKTNLREKGIEITLGRDEKGKRFITISKMPSILSMPSKTTESNTNPEKKFDSKSNNEKMLSKVPSDENDENQIQKSTLDSFDSIDSNLQTIEGKEEKEEKEDDENEELEQESPEQKWQREQEEMKKWGIGLE